MLKEISDIVKLVLHMPFDPTGPKLITLLSFFFGHKRKDFFTKLNPYKEHH